MATIHFDLLDPTTGTEPVVITSGVARVVEVTGIPLSPSWLKTVDVSRDVTGGTPGTTDVLVQIFEKDPTVAANLNDLTNLAFEETLAAADVKDGWRKNDPIFSGETGDTPVSSTNTYTASGLPTTGETVRFGSNIFEFRSTATLDSNNPLHVEIAAGDVDTTYANLVTAVNRFDNLFVLSYAAGTNILTATMSAQYNVLGQRQFTASASATRPFDISGVTNLAYTASVTGTGGTAQAVWFRFTTASNTELFVDMVVGDDEASV